MRGSTLDGQLDVFARCCILTSFFTLRKAKDSEDIRHLIPFYIIAIDVVKNKGRPVHMHKLDFIAVFEDIVGICKILLYARCIAVQHPAVNNGMPNAVAVISKKAGSRRIACLIPKFRKCCT